MNVLVSVSFPHPYFNRAKRPIYKNKHGLYCESGIRINGLPVLSHKPAVGVRMITIKFLRSPDLSENFNLHLITARAINAAREYLKKNDLQVSVVFSTANDSAAGDSDIIAEVESDVASVDQPFLIIRELARTLSLGLSEECPSHSNRCSAFSELQDASFIKKRKS